MAVLDCLAKGSLLLNADFGGSLISNANTSESCHSWLLAGSSQVILRVVLNGMLQQGDEVCGVCFFALSRDPSCLQHFDFLPKARVVSLRVGL